MLKKILPNHAIALRYFCVKGVSDLPPPPNG